MKMSYETRKCISNDYLYRIFNYISLFVSTIFYACKLRFLFHSVSRMEKRCSKTHSVHQNWFPEYRQTITKSTRIVKSIPNADDQMVLLFLLLYSL